MILAYSGFIFVKRAFETVFERLDCLKNVGVAIVFSLVKATVSFHKIV